MSIRSRILFGLFVVVGLGFYLLTDWITGDLTPRYREATEEPLVDMAETLASYVAASSKDGAIDVALCRKVFDQLKNRIFSAHIYNFTKERVDIRVYITDLNGKVIFDSDNGRDEGKDYSTERCSLRT